MFGPSKHFHPVSPEPTSVKQFMASTRVTVEDIKLGRKYLPVINPLAYADSASDE
jgi:hypothetical protein